MFAQSHIILAQEVAQKMSGGLHIPKRSFYLGSVYPDISNRYSKVSHTLEGALPVVEELVHSTVATTGPGLLMPQQGFYMGMICHFICDFFCQAHNFQEYQSSFKHYRYEMQVDFLIHQGLRDVAFTIVPLEKNGSSLQSMTDLIIKAHDEYLDAPRSYLTDLSFSVSCSCAVLTSLCHLISNQIMIPAA